MKASVRNRLINISLLLGTIVLFFGSIEVALRVTGLVSVAPNPPQIYQKSADPDISYELKPNIREKAFRATVETNGLGFRSAPLDAEKPTIAILGDSVAFGYGLEKDDMLATKLQSQLPAYNFLNTAVPGYNLLQETATYEKKVASLKPAGLILVFFENDLVNMQNATLDDKGILRGPGWTPSAEDLAGCNPIKTGILGMLPGKCWLDTHSAFYIAMKKFVSRRTENARLHEQQETMRANIFAETATEQSLRSYEALLNRLTLSLPKSMPRLFVIWPDRNPHFLARPRLKAAAEKDGFHVLDLYDIFGNAPETLPWDTVHPSAKTVNQAAEMIGAAMEYYGIARNM